MQLSLYKKVWQSLGSNMDNKCIICIFNSDVDKVLDYFSSYDVPMDFLSEIDGYTYYIMPAYNDKYFDKSGDYFG